MSVLPQLLNFIQFSVDNLQYFEPKDILMKKFKKKYGFKEYIIEPALFQHLGLQSSMSLRRIDFQNIYNVQFRPFQSYTFKKEYEKEINFNSNYFNS